MKNNTNNYLAKHLPTIQKIRDDNSACAHDLLFPDGTIAFEKEHLVDLVSSCDALICEIKSQ